MNELFVSVLLAAPQYPSHCSLNPSLFRVWVFGCGCDLPSLIRLLGETKRGVNAFRAPRSSRAGRESHGVLTEQLLRQLWTQPRQWKHRECEKACFVCTLCGVQLTNSSCFANPVMYSHNVRHWMSWTYYTCTLEKFETNYLFDLFNIWSLFIVKLYKNPLKAVWVVHRA